MRPLFQYGYSRKFAKYMYDEPSRRAKALRAAAMISEFRQDLGECVCLEMGSATGIMCYYLADLFKKVVGIEIEKEALAFAQKKYSKPNIEYFEMDAQNTSFTDKSFDVIVCHHTYEHVFDSRRLVFEIERLLKDDGICYFGAPNRLMPVESHYNLPFLSWLPRFFSTWILKILKKDDYYYERMKTLWGLKRLLKNFKIYDYTYKIFNEPQKYHSEDIAKEYRFLIFFPAFLIKIFKPFYPDYVWILKKKNHA